MVYHKRRTDFLQFYKQLHFFGRARINIYKHFPSELKLVHFFPAAFTLFIAFTLLLNVVGVLVGTTFIAVMVMACHVLLGIYILLLFFHACLKTRSLQVAFLSTIAAFIQLIAYGLGFMQDGIKSIARN